MKGIILKLAISVIACGFALNASAQSYLEDPKWGSSPEEREKNVLAFNLFRDSYKASNYNEAAKHLQQLLATAPAASETVYAESISMYKDKAGVAMSIKEKNMYIDSMVMLYDMRAENFADHPKRGRSYVLRYKALDYAANRPLDREGIMKYYKDAFDASINDVEDDRFVNSFLVNYFNDLTEEYKADNIEADYYMAEYDKILPIVEKHGEATTKSTVESLFITSGAANCDNIEKMFTDKVAAAPDDKVLLSKTFSMMQRGNCKGKFFMHVGELLYKAEPSSVVALALAAGYEETGKYSEALKYLNAALETETNPETKFNLCLRIAGSELGSKNPRNAAVFARKAIELNPNNGMAYYTLAQAYASGAESCGQGFNKQSVFWIVYDTLAMARKFFSDEENKTYEVVSQMNSYRAAFPTKEECFFRGLEEGASISVSCGWITGSTVVRQGK